MVLTKLGMAEATPSSSQPRPFVPALNISQPRASPPNAYSSANTQRADTDRGDPRTERARSANPNSAVLQGSANSRPTPRPRANAFDADPNGYAYQRHSDGWGGMAAPNEPMIGRIAPAHDNNNNINNTYGGGGGSVGHHHHHQQQQQRYAPRGSYSARGAGEAMAAPTHRSENTTARSHRTGDTTARSRHHHSHSSVSPKRTPLLLRAAYAVYAVRYPLLFAAAAYGGAPLHAACLRCAHHYTYRELPFDAASGRGAPHPPSSAAPKVTMGSMTAPAEADAEGEGGLAEGWAAEARANIASPVAATMGAVLRALGIPTLGDLRARQRAKGEGGGGEGAGAGTSGGGGAGDEAPSIAAVPIAVIVPLLALAALAAARYVLVKPPPRPHPSHYPSYGGGGPPHGYGGSFGGSSGDDGAGGRGGDGDDDGDYYADKRRIGRALDRMDAGSLASDNDNDNDAANGNGNYYADAHSDRRGHRQHQHAAIAQTDSIPSAMTVLDRADSDGAVLAAQQNENGPSPSADDASSSAAANPNNTTIDASASEGADEAAVTSKEADVSIPNASPQPTAAPQPSSIADRIGAALRRERESSAAPTPTAEKEEAEAQQQQKEPAAENEKEALSRRIMGIVRGAAAVDPSPPTSAAAKGSGSASPMATERRIDWDDVTMAAAGGEGGTSKPQPKRSSVFEAIRRNASVNRGPSAESDGASESSLVPQSGTASSLGHPSTAPSATSASAAPSVQVVTSSSTHRREQQLSPGVYATAESYHVTTTTTTTMVSGSDGRALGIGLGSPLTIGGGRINAGGAPLSRTASASSSGKGVAGDAKRATSPLHVVLPEPVVVLALAVPSSVDDVVGLLREAHKHKVRRVVIPSTHAHFRFAVGDEPANHSAKPAVIRVPAGVEVEEVVNVRQYCIATRGIIATVAVHRDVGANASTASSALYVSPLRARFAAGNGSGSSSSDAGRTASPFAAGGASSSSDSGLLQRGASFFQGTTRYTGLQWFNHPFNGIYVFETLQAPEAGRYSDGLEGGGLAIPEKGSPLEALGDGPLPWCDFHIYLDADGPGGAASAQPLHFLINLVLYHRTVKPPRRATPAGEVFAPSRHSPLKRNKSVNRSIKALAAAGPHPPDGETA